MWDFVRKARKTNIAFQGGRTTGNSSFSLNRNILCSGFAAQTQNSF
jgi:hypothetical protein